MKSLKFVLALTMLMALALTLSATPTDDEVTYVENEEEDTSYDVAFSEVEEPTSSLRTSVISRFLTQKKPPPPPPRAKKTCNKHPRVCFVKGSPGHECCNKKCVNIMKDPLNCGLCGKKCKFPEICCKGRCVNPRSHNKHCGSCTNRCRIGNVCVNGMCNYA